MVFDLATDEVVFFLETGSMEGLVTMAGLLFTEGCLVDGANHGKVLL